MKIAIESPQIMSDRDLEEVYRHSLRGGGGGGGGKKPWLHYQNNKISKIILV